MASTGSVGASALAAIPAAAATGTGIAIKIIFHDSVLAFGMAAVVGVLAVLGVLAVSAQAQETIRLWIRHRAEHKLAAAEAFEIKWRIRAATSGWRWTPGSAAQIRTNAVTYPRPGSNLAEIMKITRQPGPAAPLDPDAACSEMAAMGQDAGSISTSDQAVGAAVQAGVDASSAESALTYAASQLSADVSAALANPPPSAG